MYRFAQAYVYSILSIRSAPVGIFVAAFVDTGTVAASMQMHNVSEISRLNVFLYFSGTFCSSVYRVSKKSYSYFIIFYHILSRGGTKIYIYVYKAQIILDTFSFADMQIYAKKRI